MAEPDRQGPQPFRPPPGHPRFPLLDSLRAAAALGVFGYHLADYAGADATAAAPYAHRLNVSVTVFFVISGFVLYRPFLAAALERRPRPRIRAYARNRALRILPAYWVVLAIAALYPGLRGVHGSNWWVFASLTQVWSPGDAFNGIPPTWSLSTEASFYIALPLLVLVAHRAFAPAGRRARLRLEALLLVALFVGSNLVHQLAFGSRNVPETLLGTGDWFVIGMALALASAALPRDLGWMHGLRIRPWLPWLAALGLFVALARLGELDHLDRGFWLAEHLGYGLIAAALVLPAVLDTAAGGAPRRLLAWRPLRWLGLVSYGIFLWQIPVLDALNEPGIRDWWGSYGTERTLILGAVALPLTVACAAASYYLVERPFLRLKAGSGRGPSRRSLAPRASPAR